MELVSVKTIIKIVGYREVYLISFTETYVQIYCSKIGDS